MGVDAVAFLSMVAALALGQSLAGVVIAIMYLIPHWCQDPTDERRPINAKCETVHTLPMFRDAYHRRRCIVPVDGFFEWKAIWGQKAKQPYAVAMKGGSPFQLRSRPAPARPETTWR
jgi:putative SOS response-associated peptidase YedK